MAPLIFMTETITTRGNEKQRDSENSESELDHDEGFQQQSATTHWLNW